MKKRIVRSSDWVGTLWFALVKRTKSNAQRGAGERFHIRMNVNMKAMRTLRLVSKTVDR